MCANPGGTPFVQASAIADTAFILLTGCAVNEDAGNLLHEAKRVLVFSGYFVNHWFPPKDQTEIFLIPSASIMARLLSSPAEST